MLDNGEGEIVRQYFGVGEIPPCTLEQIGKRYHLTGERVRQVKQKALRKLRRLYLAGPSHAVVC
jgi:RNA polymerase primary sigma factor